MATSRDDSPFDGLEPPNHTQVPNALFDDLMCQMGGSELKVVLAICRQTFGWHKKEDDLSLSQLKALTGLSRQGVIDGIADGMKRGVIRRRPKGQGFMYRLKLVNKVDQLQPNTPIQAINVPPASQQSRPVPVHKVDQSEPSASQQSRPELVNKVDTQKKGKKENPTPPTNGSHDSRANGGGGEDTFTFLTDQAIGAAAEFAHIPCAVIKADYEARKKDGQTKATIVLAWRQRAPTASTIFGQSRAASAPLVATPANEPDDIIDPADLAKLIPEGKRDAVSRAADESRSRARDAWLTPGKP